jgi:8-oxo-dGTP pyrophosphatase MutT (NUDIX family)
VTDPKIRSEGWPPHRVTGVDVWPYRTVDGRSEFLLMHRSGRDGHAFWQGVSGWIEPGEAPHLTALRELREETGLEAVELYVVNSLFDLYAWRRGTVEGIVPFAALVAGDAEPILSGEHDAWRWSAITEALTRVPYEPQRAALRRISADLLERPDLAHLYRIEPPAEGKG